MCERDGMTWNELKEATSILVNIVVLLGAIVAVVKFRLFNVLGLRWRTDVECKHWELEDGSVIFVAEYTVSNTGQRTLQIQNVSMRLMTAGREGALLVPDYTRVLAEREMRSGDPNLKGIFYIEAGERTIFTLRCCLPELANAVFVLCTFNVKYKRAPAGFSGFYCRGQKQELEADAQPSVLSSTGSGKGVSTPAVQTSSRKVRRTPEPS